VTILAPLAALDAQQHALGVDIADLEHDDFRDAQPGAPRVRLLAGPRTGSGGGERRLVLRRCCRAQQQRHFLDAEHRRYPPRIRHNGEPARQVRPVERHREKEAQGRDRAVDARRLHAALRLVQLEEAQFFRRCRVWRPADKGCKCPHVSHIVAARVLLEAAHGHVFNHARPQWADGPLGGIGGHQGVLSRAEGCRTFDARDQTPRFVLRRNLAIAGRSGEGRFTIRFADTHHRTLPTGGLSLAPVLGERFASARTRGAR